MQANYAGFGSRLLAAFIDAFAVGVVNALLGFVVGMVMGQDSSTQIVVQGLGFVVGVLYWVVYQNKMKQTLGKKAMGIRVVTANGDTPGMGTLFLREFIGKLVSGITLGIGYLWMLWDGRKQCLHDKIASTFVVKV